MVFVIRCSDCYHKSFEAKLPNKVVVHTWNDHRLQVLNVSSFEMQHPALHMHVAWVIACKYHLRNDLSLYCCHGIIEFAVLCGLLNFVGPADGQKPIKASDTSLRLVDCYSSAPRRPDREDFKFEIM